MFCVSLSFACSVLRNKKKTLALLNRIARVGLFRKIIIFLVKKMIRSLLPRQDELIIVGKVLLTLQDVSPFESSEALYNRAALDGIFSSLEATVVCMVGYRNLGKVLREALNAYARNEATQKETDKKKTSDGQTPSTGQSFLQSRNESSEGQSPSAPLLAPPHSIGYGSSPAEEEEIPELGEAASQFRDAMMRRPASVWRVPWDEADTAAGLATRLRTLGGIPVQSSDVRKGSMIGLWTLTAALIGLGITAIVIFPLGTLFLWLGALALTVALLLLVLIPLVAWAGLYGRQYERVALYLGSLYRGSPEYYHVRSRNASAPSEADTSAILAFQNKFETLCQDSVASGQTRRRQ